MGGRGGLVPQGASGGRESEHPDRPRSPHQGPGSGRDHRGRLGTAGPWLPEALQEGCGRRRPAFPSRSFPGLVTRGSGCGCALSGVKLCAHRTPHGGGTLFLAWRARACDFNGEFCNLRDNRAARGAPRPRQHSREAAAASGTDRVSSACGQLGVRGQNRRAGASSPNCPGPQCHGSGHGGTDGRGQWPGGPRAPSLTAQRHPQPSPLGGCGQPPLRAPGGQDAPAPQAWLSLPTPRPRAVGE